MTITEFSECNAILAKGQPQYTPMPVYRLAGGKVISCWKFAMWERIKLLLTGKIYVGMLTFDKPVQPIFLSLNKEDIILS